MTRTATWIIAICSVALVALGFLAGDILLQIRSEARLAEAQERAAHIERLTTSSEIAEDAITRALFESGACVRQGDGSVRCR